LELGLSRLVYSKLLGSAELKLPAQAGVFRELNFSLRRTPSSSLQNTLKESTWCLNASRSAQTRFASRFDFQAKSREPQSIGAGNSILPPKR
jgi:hypothetical protein